MTTDPTPTPESMEAARALASHPTERNVERIARALDAARDKGWRAGMEEAAGVCDAIYSRIDDAGGHLRYNSTTHEEMRVAERCSDDIRARLTEGAKGEDSP